MNDVALRANDVLRNEVGLRPMKLRFAQTDTPSAGFDAKRLKCSHNCVTIKKKRRKSYE